MKVGVVGLGAVGLRLAVSFAEAGHELVEAAVDARGIATLDRGES